MSVERMRLTPALAIWSQALPSDALVSMPRQAASVTAGPGPTPHLSRVQRRPAHAEVGGEADQVDLLESAVLHVAGEAGGGLAVRLVEGGVGVHLLPVALADDQLGVRDLEVLVEVGAGRALHAVIRPEHLGAVLELYGLEGLRPGMRGGERDVPRGVPVRGQDHVIEPGRETVHQG